MAEEKEKKDSSVIGKANSLAGKGRDAQRLYSAYKKARLAMVAGEGIGSLAGAVPVVVGAIVLVVVIIIFSGASAPPVVGGEPTDTATSSATIGPNPSINPNISAQLANDLVITGSGATAQAIADVQRIMAIPYKSSKYRDLITSNGKYKVNIIILNSNSCGLNNTGGPGGIANAPINLLNWNCSFSLREKILIHETGHVIAIRNGTLGYPFLAYSTPPNPDSSCYVGSGGYLRTYSYKAGTKGTELVESFPEAISDNIVPYPTDTKYGDNIPNYSTACANTYSWIKNNIYGGVEF